VLSQRHLQLVSLDEIDWEDTAFRMSYFRDFDALKKSILVSGICNPPLLQYKTDGRYRIVCGYGRLSIAREQLRTSSEAWVIPENISSRLLFDLVFFENWSTRTFNRIEKAHIVKLIEAYFPEDLASILPQRLPLLGIGVHPQWLEWLHDVLEFPEPVQKAFSRETMSWDLMDLLKKMTGEEQVFLIQLCADLRLGKSHQKELARLLEDILRLQKTTLKDLFSSSQIHPVLEKESLTPPQKTNQILEKLKDLRYPSFSEHHKRFQRLLYSLKLPPTLQLQQDPYLEDDSCQIQFRFRSLAEFENHFQILKRIKDDPCFKKLGEGELGCKA
jgi:hypothetical protein